MTDGQADADLAFVADRLEDALDAGTVDHRAREELLAALAECDPDLAADRRS
jgi:hypothetical protein